MLRKIIRIDREKCNGCGACVTACHEGAIGLEGGVAKLLREDYCDGLGDCLPACPTGAITFEERDAVPYDEAAVSKAKAGKAPAACPGGGCPGKMARTLIREPEKSVPTAGAIPSQLLQWPCQIKLVPPRAPYFDGADLLIAADCTAYAYGAFHRDFMRGHITLIGCPKLDEGDYAEKLTEILRHNDIRSIRLLRMEVPCCGGLENALRRALAASGRIVPWQVITLTTDGKILER